MALMPSMSGRNGNLPMWTVSLRGCALSKSTRGVVSEFKARPFYSDGGCRREARVDRISS